MDDGMGTAIAARLRELARNLYWTWHPELVAIFRDMDPQVWREAGHNPVEFLLRFDEQTIEERATSLAVEARITQAFHQMRSYLEAKDTWGARHAGPLLAAPVAYFSAEFGLHESLPIYAGGLGVLAGDHLKAASDLGLPLVGVGLFYARGYFQQRMDESGWQHEEYAVSDVSKLPLDLACDEQGKPLIVSVEAGSSTIRLLIRTAQVGRTRLILLDSDVDGNTPEDRGLTANLYGGGPEMRIRQEMALGVGGMRALAAMNITPGVLHLNEGHAAFAVLELARCLMARDGRSFAEISEEAAQRCVFTTHTPVEAGHDRFDPSLVLRTLERLRSQLGLGDRELLALGRVNPQDDRESFCMTVLGLRMSRHRNGVSWRHAQITRAMWKSLWPGRPENEVPIGHVTNGVHEPSWLAIPMMPLYEHYLGRDWMQCMTQLELWDGVEAIDETEFWELHQILKAHLVEYVRRASDWQAQLRGRTPPSQQGRKLLDPRVLTVGFARRFAPYKRADLLLGDLDRLERLIHHPERPVQFIFSGKAHPGDQVGKKLAQRIFQISQDERFGDRFVFIEDHDINVDRHLVQGVDVWLNTPRRPREASGTSGMKTVLNGGLNLSVLDGWWLQGYDGQNGFIAGNGSEHSDAAYQDKIDRQSLFEVLELEVAPLFYQRNGRGIPQRWVAMQKHAIRTLCCRFSARRMVQDYAQLCYLPASGGLMAHIPGQGDNGLVKPS